MSNQTLSEGLENARQNGGVMMGRKFVAMVFGPAGSIRAINVRVDLDSASDEQIIRHVRNDFPNNTNGATLVLLKMDECQNMVQRSLAAMEMNQQDSYDSIMRRFV